MKRLDFRLVDRNVKDSCVKYKTKDNCVKKELCFIYESRTITTTLIQLSN